MAPELLDQSTPLANDEVIFRRVLPRRNHYSRDGNSLRVSSQAFSDEGMKPSVDRERVVKDLGGPTYTQQSPENGVLQLLVQDVRSIPKLKVMNERGKPVKPEREHAADVLPAPIKGDPVLPDNPAHCEITLMPQLAPESVFRRLQEKLARMATKKGNAAWAIVPPDAV